MIDVRDQFPLEPGWPRLTMDWAQVDAIVIHHTAVDPWTGGDPLLFPALEMTEEDELNHIRVIHLYHKSKHWGGFAYHIIVFPSGRAYYVTTLERWGAHVAGMNNSKFGVVLAGDFRVIPPGGTQVAGVYEAIDFIDTTIQRVLDIGPHSEWIPTSCPGKAFPLPEQEVEDMTEDEVRAIVLDMTLAYGRGEQRVTHTLGQWIGMLNSHVSTHHGSTLSTEEIANNLKIVKK